MGQGGAGAHARHHLIVAAIGWRQKAALQRIIDKLPAAHRFNYLLQRHVTHGLPRADAKVTEAVELAAHHIDVLSEHGTVPVGEATFFEFGAGWDLAMPLALYALGAGHQVVVDIRPLVRADLVRDLAGRIDGFAPDRPWRSPPTGPSLSDVLTACGIDYRAPCDARATGLDDDSVDYVTSTNTLEHIPRTDLADILRECRRILRPGGAMSFQVDYQDHYWYFDKAISAYNYLRFDDQEWKRHNPSIHFQNRLRHSDYHQLYAEAGFEIVDDVVARPSDDDLATVASLPPAPPFRHYDAVDLATRGARTVLRKRG